MQDLTLSRKWQAPPTVNENHQRLAAQKMKDITANQCEGFLSFVELLVNVSLPSGHRLEVRQSCPTS
jgi:hypothetical protein